MHMRFWVVRSLASASEGYAASASHRLFCPDSSQDTHSGSSRPLPTTPALSLIQGNKQVVLKTIASVTQGGKEVGCLHHKQSLGPSSKCL